MEKIIEFFYTFKKSPVACAFFPLFDELCFSTTAYNRGEKGVISFCHQRIGSLKEIQGVLLKSL